MQDKRSTRKNKGKGLSGGVKYGPPPKKGPNPQGIELNRAKRLLRQALKKK